MVYSLTQTDVAANKRSSALYLLGLKGEAQPQKLAISEGGANTARWGADGKLYEGFVAASADKIFESTNRSAPSGRSFTPPSVPPVGGTR